MRPYLKLLVALVAPAVCWCVLRTDVASDVFLGARFTWVNAYGSTAEQEQLNDEVGLALAREDGNVALFLVGVEYRAKLAELRAGGVPPDEAVDAAREAVAEAYGQVPDIMPTTAPAEPVTEARRTCGFR
jgi:hypothetical protein